MSTFQAAIARMRALGDAGLAVPPTTQPEIRRQFQRLDQPVGERKSVEELRPFLIRAQSSGTQSLRRVELNRVLRGVWCDESFDELGIQAVDRADGDKRRSTDQAMIEGYLTYFPRARPIVRPLAAAAKRAANRHDWAWRRRAETWSLFDTVQGPQVVGSGLVRENQTDAAVILYDAGLGGNLCATNFGRAAFVAACREAADLKDAAAVAAQRRLLGLFDKEAQASDLHMLVRAILQPWLNHKPEADHRKALSAFLLDQVGDPRINHVRWSAITSALAEEIGADGAAAISLVFKRWLTEVAMREFFRAIAKTTDRPDQWQQRESFWLAYLDGGLVSDAWPALGQRARHGVDQIIRESGERPEYGVMRGGPLSSSSIIMQIGDLRIAEWSDNGSCRFWSDHDPKAPKLYSKQYDGGALRTTIGRSDFIYESHVPASPGWEGKFAGIIHRRTGVAHPRFGRGRERNRSGNW